MVGLPGVAPEFLDPQPSVITVIRQPAYFASLWSVLMQSVQIFILLPLTIAH